MFLFEQLQAMDRNLIFSGQLFFRYAGPAVEVDLSARSLFSVVGIIAVPENVTEIKGEHQYVIAGHRSNMTGIIMGIDPQGKDLTNLAAGNTPDGLLLKPIWKI